MIVLNTIIFVFLQMTQKTTNRYAVLLLMMLGVIEILAQSNYASHANNVEYIGTGLPGETVLDGKVSNICESLNSLFLNKK